MRKTIVAAAVVVVGATLGATVLREPVAHAAQSVSATIIGPLDASGNVAVHEQGTANVAVQGPVATQAALPANSFSSTADSRNISIGCGQNLPAGTRWFVTSFSVTNNSTSDTSIGISIESPTFPDVFGPKIAVNAGATGQLTFPQPYVLTSPRAGDCLVVGEQDSVTTSLVGYFQ